MRPLTLPSGILVSSWSGASAVPWASACPAEARSRKVRVNIIFMVCSFPSQPNPRTGAPLARAFVSAAGRGGILDAESAAVENHDVVRRCPAGPPAGDELAQFGIQIGLRHRAGAQCVVQIAHHGAL